MARDGRGKVEMTRPGIIAGPDEGEDPDAPDLDDEPDGGVEPPRQPAKAQRRQPDREPGDDAPTYQELMEEVVGLRERTRKNNQELQKRRQVQQWMEAHGIEDLDSWLSGLGVDRQTGQPTSAPPSADSPPAGTGSDAEVARRVALATEQHQAQLEERESAWTEERERLHGFVVSTAIEPALIKNGFTGGDVGRALKVMDIKSVKVESDDDGLLKLTGLDEAIAALKNDIPEWFRPRGNGSRPPRSGGDDVDGGRKPPARPKPATWEEQVNRRLSGAR